LHDPDQTVAQNNADEQGVLRESRHEDEHEQRADDSIDRSDDVRPDDLSESSRRRVRRGIYLARGNPLGDLIGSQPTGGEFDVLAHRHHLMWSRPWLYSQVAARVQDLPTAPRPPPWHAPVGVRLGLMAPRARQK